MIQEGVTPISLANLRALTWMELIVLYVTFDLLEAVVRACVLYVRLYM